ncbi:DUF3579 domain-containing protein [Trinickia dinghuensis]|uniref:DUF3579 domain-containing protein n=1 Tax=Trinickia dinghuensis TaxID=2291023 RepID=A0A3D8JZ71_9BURK|nr:DUF3579 domain-containing protein [Trinickia dinghuensis]RDU97946.1 DUF3579 domain-containing protein [Trinickia dinghuensis]
MTTIDHPPNRIPGFGRAGHRIVGVTHGGKQFRPGDWAERLAGVITLFVKERRPGRGVASTWLAIPFVDAGVRCLSVSGELAEICPEAFEFVMRFAEDNELPVHADELAISR